MAPLHQKLTNKTAVEKCKALKDVEKGMLNKQVAGKYRVPRNSVSMGKKQGKVMLWTFLEVAIVIKM